MVTKLAMLTMLISNANYTNINYSNYANKQY